MARARRLVERVQDETGMQRDEAMARLMAARVSLQAAMDAVDEAGAIFVNPDEDPKGKERKQLIADALEAAGVASRALEAAEETVKAFDRDDWKEREPWEDGDDEDGDDDDEED